MSTQCRPYDSLGLGRIRSQRSRPHALLRRYVPTRCFCALNHYGCCFCSRPPPPPPPTGGGRRPPPLPLCFAPSSQAPWHISPRPPPPLSPSLPLVRRRSRPSR